MMDPPMPSPSNSKPTALFDAFQAGLPSMAGKTVVITGTTSGTGRASAEVLAGQGAKLLVLNRASGRSAKMIDELNSSFPDAQIHGVDCDLQSFASVEAAAAKVKELCPEGVDVLCNNAGVMALEDRATDDGFDVQMQTNHLSHFLLTRELMPLLDKAADSKGEARIVNHSSIARMAPKKTLIGDYLEKKGGDLGGDGASMFFGGARWVRYGQSKLANAAFTAALHQRLSAKGSKVKAMVAHPGLSSTELQKTSVKNGGMGGLSTKLFMTMSQTPAEGAMGILSCMCLPEAKSGEFYGPGAKSWSMRGPARPFALEGFYDNDATRDLLWSKSCDAIGREFAI